MRRFSISQEKAALLSTAAVMLLFGALTWRPWEQVGAWKGPVIYAASVFILGGALDYLYGGWRGRRR